MNNSFLQRDISWLSFNRRVLQEAMQCTLPLMERFRFLSIYSSNLDEFYRVRMPALMLLKKIKSSETDFQWLQLQKAKQLIREQQEDLGKHLTGELIPALQKHNIELLHGKPIPAAAIPDLKIYFQTEVVTFLEIHKLKEKEIRFLQRAIHCTRQCFVKKKTERKKRSLSASLQINCPVFFLFN